MADQVLGGQKSDAWIWALVIAATASVVGVAVVHRATAAPRCPQRVPRRSAASGWAAATPRFREGKSRVVDFWATWCGPCRSSMPRVQKLWQEYQPKGVELYSVDTDDEAPDPRRRRVASSCSRTISPSRWCTTTAARRRRSRWRICPPCCCSIAKARWCGRTSARSPPAASATCARRWTARSGSANAHHLAHTGSWTATATATWYRAQSNVRPAVAPAMPRPRAPMQPMQ